MTKKDAALVLFSGGQDSTTCLFWAKKNFSIIEAICFDYGQRHIVELEQAAIIAQKANVQLSLFNIRGLLEGSALLNDQSPIFSKHFRNKNLPASFVPSRNALFLTIAANHAYNRGISTLIGGMCETDYSGYPDCRRVFLDSMEQSLSLALDFPIEIVTPLMHLSKAETWKMAKDLGILEIVKYDSHTDYNGNRSQFNEWGYGKLDNPASVIRAKGYQEAKANGWI